MVAFFHVCGAVTGDRISSCGFLWWFFLVLSSRSLDSHKTWLYSSTSSRASFFFYPTLYFLHFLYTVNKAAAVHLYVFIGGVFKDLRISPPLISNEEAKRPCFMCACLCVCLSVFVYAHGRLGACTGLCIGVHLVRFCFFCMQTSDTRKNV